MSAFPPAVLAKQAVQKERARLLYRRSLKQILSWAVHRELFYVEADKTRAAFDANKDETDFARIDRLLTAGENKLAKMAHPDPYTVPWAPGGSKYARNPPVPPENILLRSHLKEVMEGDPVKAGRPSVRQLNLRVPCYTMRSSSWCKSSLIRVTPLFQTAFQIGLVYDFGRQEDW